MLLRAVLLLPLLAVLGCTSDQDLEPHDTTPADAPAVLPTLRIDSPARGAFLGQGEVVLSGEASAGSADLDSLVISDADVSWGPTGMINQAWTPQSGLTLLGARLEDVDAGVREAAVGALGPAVSKGLKE